MTKWNKSEAWQLLICSHAIIIHLDASSVIEVLSFQSGSNSPQLHFVSFQLNMLIQNFIKHHREYKHILFTSEIPNAQRMLVDLCQVIWVGLVTRSLQCTFFHIPIVIVSDSEWIVLFYQLINGQTELLPGRFKLQTRTTNVRMSVKITV